MKKVQTCHYNHYNTTIITGSCLLMLIVTLFVLLELVGHPVLSLPL